MRNAPSPALTRHTGHKTGFQGPCAGRGRGRQGRGEGPPAAKLSFFTVRSRGAPISAWAPQWHHPPVRGHLSTPRKRNAKQNRTEKIRQSPLTWGSKAAASTAQPLWVTRRGWPCGQECTSAAGWRLRPRPTWLQVPPAPPSLGHRGFSGFLSVGEPQGRARRAAMARPPGRAGEESESVEDAAPGPRSPVLRVLGCPSKTENNNI